ncbi:MAG: hypothetical protein ACR2QE_04765 [Acidimicrobiales bacterium]
MVRWSCGLVLVLAAACSSESTSPPDTRSVPVEASVPATGGPPRSTPVGRIAGDLETAGRVVLVDKAARIVDLETGEVAEFDVPAEPLEFEPTVPVGDTLLYASGPDSDGMPVAGQGVVVAVDTSEPSFEVTAQGDLVAPSSIEDRFWVGQVSEPSDGAGPPSFRWIERSLDGTTHRAVETTGAPLGAEVYREGASSTWLLTADAERYVEYPGLVPVARVGHTLLAARCPPGGEFFAFPNDECSKEWIDITSGEPAPSPFPDGAVDAAPDNRMDRVVTSGDDRYMAVVDYLDDSHRTVLVDVETGAEITTDCSDRAFAWSPEEAVYACVGSVGLVVHHTESGQRAEYGLGGGGFFPRLLFFVD